MRFDRADAGDLVRSSVSRVAGDKAQAERGGWGWGEEVETGGLPIFSLKNRDEKNSAQNFPHINKSNVNFSNTGSNSRFLKMGNKGLFGGKLPEAKKLKKPQNVSL